MKQYEMYELSMTGKKLTDNQVRIQLDVAVTVDGETKTVRAFYDGENENGEGVYKVRIYPEKTGEYKIIVKENEYNVCAEKRLFCEPKPENSMHHGIVQPNETHYRYADGTWF